MEQRKWYRLDTTGNLYPSVLSRRNTTLFRLAVQLKKPVHVDRLNRSFREVLGRFPYYRVQLRRGAFWYTFVENDRDPSVMIDGRSPCGYLPLKKRGVFPFRVRVYGKNLAVEFSHALTDATGALIFLKTLLGRYVLLGLKEADGGSCVLEAELKADLEIFDPEEAPREDESTDAFRLHYDPSIPSPDQEKKVFHLEGNELPTGTYRVLTGELSVREVLAAAKGLNLSLTEYLVSVYFYCLQDIQEKSRYGRKRGKLAPLSVMVPVNLRSILPSRTMRNFFLTLNPLIDTRLGHYSFEDIAVGVHHFMGTAIDRRHLKQQIARNVRGRIHPLLRIAPLFIKDIALKLIYLDYGESRFSGSLSNLGKIDLPPSLDREVERIVFVPPPSPVLKVKCGVLSRGDRLAVTFGSLIGEKDLELRFFSFLRKAGIRVKLHGNYKGEE